MESRINRHIATMSICLSLVLTLMASFSNPVVVAQTPTTTHISIVPNASTLTNTAFSPDTVTVVIGVNNTVSWTNNDNVIHTVVGDSFGALNTGNISPGASATFTFGTAGTYPYHCSIHPGMVGTVVVKGSAASGGGGIPEFPYQLVTAAVLVAGLVGYYLFIRRRSSQVDIPAASPA